MLRTRPQLTAFDWEQAVADLGEGDFVYLDPPYRGADAHYGNEAMDFERMCAVLRAAPFRWLLSEYDQAFYRERLGDPVAVKQVQVVMVTAKRGRRETEALWQGGGK